ncbi:MAG: hypothetical protein ACE5KE_01695 [Methanosarcinales archaeon]
MERGKGLEIDLPKSYDNLKREAEETAKLTLAKYPKAERMYKILINDPEVNGCWDVANYIAVTRLNYNDHGEIHAKIVAANAVKMLSLLVKDNIEPDLVKYGGGTYDLNDSFLVVISAGLLHDIGIQIDREEHNLYSTFLSLDILKRTLSQIYQDQEKLAEIRGFILHAIYSHRAKIPDYSIEAALGGIADGTDMTKGRGRLAFDLGSASIHTVSALAIEKATILEGKKKPIRILVDMSNSAGIFQVEETIADKIEYGPLEEYIEVIAATIPAEGVTDKRIIYEVVIENGKIVARGSEEKEEYIKY